MSPKLNDETEGQGSLSITNILLVITIVALLLMGYFVYKFFQQPIPPQTTPSVIADTKNDNPIKIDQYPCSKGYVCTDKGQIKQ